MPSREEFVQRYCRWRADRGPTGCSTRFSVCSGWRASPSRSGTGTAMGRPPTRPSRPSARRWSISSAGASGSSLRREGAERCDGPSAHPGTMDSVDRPATVEVAHDRNPARAVRAKLGESQTLADRGCRPRAGSPDTADHQRRPAGPGGRGNDFGSCRGRNRLGTSKRTTLC